MLSYPIYTKEKSCSCGTYISSGNTHTHTSHKYVALRVLMCFEGNRNLDKREVPQVLGSTLTLEWSHWRDFWVEDLALKYNQMFLVEQMKNTKALTEASLSCLRNNQKQNKTATTAETGVARTEWVRGWEMKNVSGEVGRTEWGSGFYSTEKVREAGKHASYKPSPRLWAWTLTMMESLYHESLHRGFVKGD